MKRRMFVLAAPLLVAACAPKKETRFDFGAAKKTYPMKGKVLRLREETRVATIQHERIGDWMEPMTMEFPVPSEPEFERLKIGSQVRATVNVNDSYFWLTAVTVE